MKRCIFRPYLNIVAIPGHARLLAMEMLEMAWSLSFWPLYGHFQPIDIDYL